MLGMTSVPCGPSGMQRRDQADRPPSIGFTLENAVDEKYSARLYTKLEQLLDQGVPVDKVHWGKSVAGQEKEAGVLSFNKKRSRLRDSVIIL